MFQWKKAWMLVTISGGDPCLDIWVPKGHHTWMLVEDGTADLHPGVLSATILYKTYEE